MSQRCIKCRKGRKTKSGLCENCRLNAGTGRILTPEESARKTKDWPKEDDRSMAEVNMEGQRRGYQFSNLPPGMIQGDLE